MYGRSVGDGTSADRRASGYGRVNVQIHSLSERRPLHVRTNVSIVLSSCLLGCPQPRAPPPGRFAGADEVLRRDIFVEAFQLSASLVTWRHGRHKAEPLDQALVCLGKRDAERGAI
jgi:hypothetical protein